MKKAIKELKTIFTRIANWDQICESIKEDVSLDIVRYDESPLGPFNSAN